jgi:O-antigen ligase
VFAVVAFLSWIGISAVRNDEDLLLALIHEGAPYLCLVLGFLTGRLILSAMPLVAISVATAGFATVVAVGSLGYRNAMAAFAVQALAMALIAHGETPAFSSQRRWTGIAAWACGVAILVLGSVAGLITGLLVAAARFVVVPARPRQRALYSVAAGAVLAVASAVQLTFALSQSSSWLESALSQRRLDLWSDALELIRSEPLFGHGPGMFAVLSPTALSDPDTRPAHSVLLEVGAELGVVGVVMLMMIVAWGYWRLGITATQGVLVGLAAWTAIWLHSLVDYVYNFSSVLLMAGLVLGVAVGNRSRSAVKPTQAGKGVLYRPDGAPDRQVRP